jgi:hypothetical protein
MSSIAQTTEPWSANVEQCCKLNRPEAPKTLAAPQEGAVVTGIEPIRVISFLLLAACGALCQNLPSADLPQGSRLDDPNPPEMQRPEMRTWRSLPDAPSPVRPPTPGADGVSSGVLRETELGHLTPEPQPSLTAHYQLGFPQKQSHDFSDKYLYPQSLKPVPGYAPSNSGSFLNRVAYAASSLFVTRNASGRGRLNTSYFFGTLTLAAAHTAYRPYWERSSSAVFNDFGVSIGSNAGMNVFHEFEPGIRQKVKVLTPKFVYRIEDHITHGQTPRDSVSIPAR